MNDTFIAWLALCAVLGVVVASRYTCRTLACALLTWDDAQAAWRRALRRNWARNWAHLFADARGTGPRTAERERNIGARACGRRALSTCVVMDNGTPTVAREARGNG